MNKFLWVEDFENEVKPTLAAVCGHLLQEIPENKFRAKKTLKEVNIFLELTFTSALQFIRNPENLVQIDYVLLDIDLELGETDQLEDFSNIVQRFVNESELKRLAGYELYLQLVINHNFPKEKILFCSDHGNQLKTINQAFKDAKMPLPILYNKGENNNIKQWFIQRKEPLIAYEILRKGIFEGCQTALSTIQQDVKNIQFCEFIQNAKPIEMLPIMQDYLKVLQGLLQIKEPSAFEKYAKFKLFMRTLAHEWEDKVEPHQQKNHKIKHTFAQITKCVRNWSAHTQYFDKLNEFEIAFFFMIAMRAMFKFPDEIQSYEILLLKLFPNPENLLPDDQIITTKLSDSFDTLLDAYIKVCSNKNKAVKLNQLDYIHIIKEMEYHEKDTSSFNYLQGLFEMFWHGLSPINLAKPLYKRNEEINLTFSYLFDLHDYHRLQTDHFLHYFARHFYNHF